MDHTLNFAYKAAIPSVLKLLSWGVKKGITCEKIFGMEGLEMRLSPRKYRQVFSGILTYEPKGNHIERPHCSLKKWGVDFSGLNRWSSSCLRTSGAEKQEDCVEVEGEQVIKVLQLGGWADTRLTPMGSLQNQLPGPQSSKQLLS